MSTTWQAVGLGAAGRRQVSASSWSPAAAVGVELVGVERSAYPTLSASSWLASSAPLSNGRGWSAAELVASRSANE